MPKKLKFPVAKMREDGTPAIWLTYTNWSIMRDGIVRKYLDTRADLGKLQARREARRRIADWKSNERLKTWAMLDGTWGLATTPEEVLELYSCGFDAYRQHDNLRPERLVALGASHQDNAYQAELAEIYNFAKEAAA